MLRPISSFPTLAMALLFAASATPLHAGELWIDYLEQRFAICPTAGAEAATIDERAADFLHDMVYELDKEIAPDDPELSVIQDPSGKSRATIGSAHQSQLGERLDRMESSLRLLLPPVQSSASPSAGLHAPLRAAFAKILDRTPVDDAGTEEMLGPVLDEFIAAKAAADILLSTGGDELKSKDLLVALEQMDDAYRKARPALLGLVEREDFSALLEMQLWAECLGGAERKDG